MRFFPYGAAKTETAALERARTQIQGYARHWRERGFGVWALEDRADGGFVGRVGLRHVDELDEVEILYLIVRARWRQGLASEAGRRVPAFAFANLGLHEVIALAMPENVASRAVMAKLSMRHRNAVRIYGADLVCYAIGRDGGY